MKDDSYRKIVCKGHTASRRKFVKGLGALAAAGAFPPLCRGGERKDVIVIGAGLSGLYAAMLLEQAGLSVTVVEGSDRIGGRLYTLDDVPGKPEAGGQTIGPSYGRMLFLAMQYGIPLAALDYNLGKEPVRQILNVNGERVLPAAWATSAHNPFPEKFKKFPPDRLLMQLMGKPPMSEPNQWQSPEYYALDFPVADFLREQGFDQRAIDMMAVSNNYGADLDTTSLLFMHRNHQIIYQAMTTPGGQKYASEGNQRVPEAMARALRGDVVRQQKVVSIRQKNNTVTVHCDDGTQHQAAYVISSMPFTTMRHVDIQPGLPAMQAEAVAKLDYGQVYQAHFVVDKPFWEGKGFLPNVWSNSLIERVFASDPGNSGEITNLTVWINGKAVDQLESLSVQQAEKKITEDFYRVLPEARGNVSLAKLFSWGQQPFAQGSFATWAPGQIARYSSVMAKPAGNLHFAGEHTAQWASGMEGALESGERAAREVMEKL